MSDEGVDLTIGKETYPVHRDVAQFVADSCVLIDRLRAEIEALRAALQELRIRLHAAGRRPEECYEMSLIDDCLAAPQP